VPLRAWTAEHDRVPRHTWGLGKLVALEDSYLLNPGYYCDSTPAVIPKTSSAISAFQATDRAEIARFCEDEESRRRNAGHVLVLAICPYIARDSIARYWWGARGARMLESR
jgi:hypothetical protein